MAELWSSCGLLLFIGLSHNAGSSYVFILDDQGNTRSHKEPQGATRSQFSGVVVYVKPRLRSMFDILFFFPQPAILLKGSNMWEDLQPLYKFGRGCVFYDRFCDLMYPACFVGAIFSFGE